MSEQQPSLSGQLHALLREGAKDLHNAIVPAFPQSQRGVDEPGTPLSPTSQMVTEDLNYESTLDKYAQQAPPQQENEQVHER